MGVKLLSRVHHPGDIEDVLEIVINGRKYSYMSNAIIADGFEAMLRYDRKGFKALNFLKKHSECRGELV